MKLKLNKIIYAQHTPTHMECDIRPSLKLRYFVRVYMRA